MPLRAHSLDPLFRPRSVAVLGATPTPGRVGNVLLRNLLGSPFGGVVYAVNPGHPAVQGVRCYPTLADVPEAVDLAVLAAPAAAVPGLVSACAGRGVKAAVIVSADFAAPDAQGPELVAQVRAAARGPMRVLGPDCLGVLRPPGGLNASLAAMPARGHVAVLSQSGAIGAAILDWARDRHVGFSAFVAAGAMADVDFADLIDYLGDDPQTHSIILYVESVGDVRRFLSAARAAARTKTLIAVKAGRTEPAARAVASHTGARAGRDAVFDAAFRRVGILRVDAIPDLFAMAEVLALQPQPRGPALAILTNAGGPGVMATDALVRGGGQLALLSPTTWAALDAVLPPAWSHANPIDLLGDATPERYRQALEVCARDPAVQGLLMLLTPQALTDPTETARQLTAFARIEGKPVLAPWMGGSAVEPGRAVLAQAGIPHFDAPESAIAAFLHMAQYRRNQELLYERPRAQPEDWWPDQERVRQILGAVRAEGRPLLTEVEAKEVLAAYGIPVAPALPCRTADEAVAAARGLGYPVAVKLLSRTVTHKSEAGGVVLNVTDDDAVRRAFAAIAQGLPAHSHAARFEGVTVQPMVRDPGCELIVGSATDPQFGPVLLFGAGGTLAEVFQDRALGLPPLTGTLARRLMERTRVYRALQEGHGRGPADLGALETLLVRFSRLAADFVELAEIEVNPLLAGPGRLVALDARAVLAPPGAPPPTLAIRPYPNQLTAPFRLRDGSAVVVRVIRPEDEPLLIALHASLSPQTIRRRFFSMVKALAPDSLIRLCHLDYDREMALVAMGHDDAGQPFLLGVSRYYLQPETGEAEFAVVVGDRWQGEGLGWHLMRRLIDVARAAGVRRLTGTVLSENAPMLQLVQELGFTLGPTDDPSVTEAVLDLTG